MSQHYPHNYVDPTPVWVQPDSEWPEVVPPTPSQGQMVPSDNKWSSAVPAPAVPDWAAARRRLNIYWSVAMAVVVIAAVAIGASAGILAVKNARDSCVAAGTAQSATPPPPPSRTPSPLPSPVSAGGYRADPSSFSMPLAPSAIQQLATPALACPTAVATSTYNSSGTFKTYCGQAFGFTNLAGFIAYDFADCVDACLSYNLLRGGADSCVAVSMAFNLGSWMFAQGSVYGNCYLKGLPLSSMVSLPNAWTAALCKDQKCEDWYKAGAG